MLLNTKFKKKIIWKKVLCLILEDICNEVAMSFGVHKSLFFLFNMLTDKRLFWEETTTQCKEYLAVWFLWLFLICSAVVFFFYLNFIGGRHWWIIFYKVMSIIFSSGQQWIFWKVQCRCKHPVMIQVVFACSSLL